MTALGLPMAAQNDNRGGNTTIKNYVQSKEGTPAYYEYNTRTLFKQGKWEAGRKMVEEGLENYESLSSLNELYGQYWLHHNQYDKARFYLIRSLQDDKKNVHSKEMMMKLEELTKHYSTALVYCNELLEVSPYDITLWRKKIELYRLMGNTVEASRLVERLMQIYPESTAVRQEVEGDLENKYRNARKSGNLVSQEEALRKLVAVNPKNAEFQMALCNLLLRSGRTEEAIDVAGYAATMVASPFPFVEKRASILAEMGRYGEALTYVKSAQASIRGIAASRLRLSGLIDKLETEAARAAAQNDPYTAYAKLYDRTHSEEALTYLLNTSTSRGYLDDALMYTREARKRHGDTEKLLYREYTIQRRLGNTRAANNLLERIHNKWPGNKDVNEELCAVRLEDVRRMMDAEQWSEAITVLEDLTLYDVDSETKYAIERRLFTCYVKSGQRQKALAQLEMIDSDKEKSAQLYEEVMMPYIKSLIAQGSLQRADDELQKVLDKGYPSADLLQVATSVAMQMKNYDKAHQLVTQGRNLYPNDPYFLLKEAQLKIAEGDYATAYDMLHSMLDTYSGDSAVIGAYAECCEVLAMRYAKASGYEAALRLIDEAMEYYPGNQSLILAKSQILEKQKEWAQAAEVYKLYKPTPGEVKEYNFRMESLKRHLLTNQVMLDYQRARPSGEDAITSQVTIEYTKTKKHNAYTLGVVYAGRDGETTPNTTNDDAKGGSGVQLNGEWMHEWNTKLSTNITAGVANKFLPRIKVGIAGSYLLKNEWTAKANASYRLIGTNYKTSLFGVGVGAEKPINQFSLGADMHLFSMFGEDTEYLSSRLSVSGGIIAKCYPVEGNRSHIYFTGSVGNAPEMSLIDNSIPVKFHQLNTMLGFGGQYFFNSMIDVGLSGTWYTMSVSSITAEVGNTKNYLYLNANVAVHF